MVLPPASRDRIVKAAVEPPGVNGSFAKASIGDHVGNEVSKHGGAVPILRRGAIGADDVPQSVQPLLLTDRERHLAAPTRRTPPDQAHQRTKHLPSAVPAPPRYRCRRRKNASVSPAYVSLPMGVVTTPPGSVFTAPARLGAVLTTSVLVARASRLLFETLANT
jgi:hypothetical protein